MSKKDDPHLRLGLITLFVFALLVLIGGIKNAMAYRNHNLDISGIGILVSCVGRNPPNEQGNGQVGEKEETNPQEKGETSFGQLIEKYSQEYSVRASLLKCIIWYESTNNPNAVGNQGEQGLAQFKLSTFRSFREQMGEDEKASPFDPETAIQTLAWALSKGYGNHWSVYRRCL